MAETPKTVAILIYPGVSMLELTANYAVLFGLTGAKYQVAMVAEQSEPLKSDTPLFVAPQKSLDEMPSPNILAVMGGGLPSVRVIGSQVVRNYLISAAQTADYMIGFGTGSLVLAACGLLNNRLVATHWAFSGLVEAFGARYARERWVEDGKFITTAGGTAGMDMGLTLLSRLAGEKSARLLQLFAEYDPQPPFGGIDWQQVNGRNPVHFSPDELQALVQAVADQPDLLQAVHTWAGGITLPSLAEKI